MLPSVTVRAVNDFASTQKCWVRRSPCVVPDLVSVLVEDQSKIGLRESPGAELDLAFELVGSPAGVAEGHEDFGRLFTAMVSGRW
jgi:hypothetical protein